MRRREKKCRSTAASAAILAAALAAVPIAKAADSPPEITWSLSGSTAMRNFTISTGFTVLEAGDPDLTLSNGTYSAGAGGLQLAPSTFTGTNLAGSTGAGVRVEWHEQGSVEGVLELVNDQIGYTGGIGGTPLIATALRDPIPGGNPIRVNRNNITGPGISGGGYTILHSTYNTYDPTVYNTAGTNLQGGQNRVQMAISDVVPLQGFSKSGGTGGISLTPGAAGYGKGNSALSAAVGPGVTDINGTGLASGRQQLVDDDFLNMKTSITDPQTGAAYASGAWNTGGVNNLTTKTVAVTATVFTANPGTGLTQINKGDAQWLQTTGRLQNGLDFNVAQRDVNSGTRNVAALNTGVDPSWAVGEDDAGNGNNDPANGGSAALGTAVQQSAIGQFMKFSGKTAGGGQLRPTVQNNRMAIGPLGMSDAIGAVKNNSNANPLRALAYSNTATDSGANFVQPSASSITDGSYVIWQNEQYVTVRSPDANYADDNAIKGDSGKTAGTNGDVAKLRNNILSSVNVHFPNAATLNDPADQLLAQSFILPQMMLVSKQVDGGATSDVSTAVVNGQTHSSWRSQFLADPNLPGNFNTLAAASVTAGSGSNYGVTSTTSLAGGAAAVPITAEDSSGNNTAAAAAPKGNYLFGNFNQTGVRDLSAVEAAQAAQAALFTAGGAAAVDVNNAGVSNSTKIAGVSSALGSMNAGTGPSKGDLVVLGDFNGDGKFNGLDLYQMARGAAVSDANGSGFTNGTLTATAANFGDKLRGGILRKNAALDFMQANAT
ncbi:MAG TPA: hypothetical protein VKK61_12340, partial [Tepidisphaeraceae bacterium]|nr:hypothetical protein [Tepidisphaeraceae bacterium]